jgi:hypothetical protein
MFGKARKTEVPFTRNEEMDPSQNHVVQTKYWPLTCWQRADGLSGNAQ